MTPDRAPSPTGGDAWTQRLADAIGERYAVRRELGGGGMSRVFLAEERALGRRVVVKLLPEELAGAVNAGRFRREVLLSAQLQHPHIVPVLAAGEVDGAPYFVMPFVDGESLRARLARGALPVAEVVRILRDVAAALAYAHGRGVVHRDVKPDNVLLSGGIATVTDFGVAKALGAAGREPGAKAGEPVAADDGVTVAGFAVGTPAYMAPEQAAGDPSTDHRADIYALGVVAFELLVGRSPFAGRSPSAILAAHAVEAVPRADMLRPRVPRALADLVERCLEKHPVDRPQTALEVLRSLESPAALRDERGVARRLLRRATGWRAAAVMAVTALVAGALAQPIRARAAAPRASISFAGVTTSGPDSVLAAVLAEFTRVRLGTSPALRLRGGDVAAVVAVVDGRVTRHASGAIGLALSAHDPVTGEPIAALRELARSGEEMAAIERLDDRFAELLAGALRRESPEVLRISRRR